MADTKHLSTEINTENNRPFHAPSVFSSLEAFEKSGRLANALSSSTLVPKEYQGNTANTLIALEMAQRTGSSPLAVMQNVYIVHGRPSWSSQFVIAALNSCGRFSPLRFKVEGQGDNETCTAWTYDREHGDVLEGPPVSIKMAKDEGWYGKNGSKWKTMPQLMLRYRAAKFFGNLYAPDILMGMHTQEEVEDFGDNNHRHANVDLGEASRSSGNKGKPKSADKKTETKQEEKKAEPAKASRQSADQDITDAEYEEVRDEPQNEQRRQPQETPPTDAYSENDVPDDQVGNLDGMFDD